MRAPLITRRTSEKEEEDGRLAAAISLDLMRSKQRLLEQEFALEQQKQSLSHKERLLQVKEEIVLEQQTRLSQQQTSSEGMTNQAMINALREQAVLQQELAESLKVIEQQRKDITGLHLQLSTAQQLAGLNHQQGTAAGAAVNVEELLVSRKRAFDALQDIQSMLQQERQERTIAARTNAGRPRNNKNDSAPSVTTGVDKSQLETLTLDLLQQERLLSSYEKENDRLSLLLKQQEGEFKGKEMLLQERCVELNKQVNSLQNKLRDSGVILTAVGKEGQAVNLRKELNLDAAIKDLQEKLYSLKKEHSQKERDLISTIDSLREDNGRLLKANSALKATEAEDLRRVLTQREQEVAALRAKIDWFVDNQQVMGQLEGRLADTIAMKKNLSEAFVGMTGMNAEQVEMIARTGKPPANHDSSQSMFGLQSPSSGRNFNDVKKIKELEVTIRDLREVMAKRFPDSVAGLIQASKVVDSKQEEQQRSLRQRINELEAALSEAGTGYEQKLRLLRLDYERVQAGSKQTIESLQSQLKAAASNGCSSNGSNSQRGLPSSTAAGYAMAIEDWSQRQELSEIDPSHRVK